eukprot:scaffold4161_cov22-Prasinocladus_malaysianus.AAC.3
MSGLTPGPCRPHRHRSRVRQRHGRPRLGVCERVWGALGTRGCQWRSPCAGVLSHAPRGNNILELRPTGRARRRPHARRFWESPRGAGEDSGCLGIKRKVADGPRVRTVDPTRDPPRDTLR